MDECRRRAHEPAPAAAVPEYGEELTGVLIAAFRRLSEEQRTVLGMKLLRGARFAEIATSLGIGESAAKMRLLRALRALREELEREGVEP